MDETETAHPTSTLRTTEPDRDDRAEVRPHRFTPAKLIASDRGRTVLRLIIAIGVSGAICQFLRRAFAPELSGSYDIVGFPTYADFDFERPFWTYRLLVYAFPLIAIVGYALLWRFGPLRSRVPAPAKRTIERVEPAPEVPDAGPAWAVVPRLLLPAGVVTVAASSRTGHTDPAALGSGLWYLVIVICAAAVWGRRTGTGTYARLSAVNGPAGAVAAVLGLWFVSAHTVVHSDRGDRYFPWLAWWLAVPGVLAIGWWTWRQLRRGRPGRDIERALLTVVVGATALFLALSAVPGEVGHYAGYDDGLEMAGANMLSHGYFPWRDIFFVHGLFPDALTGTLGRAVFGDTVWAVWAMHSVVLIPLVWVFIYFFAAWASRRNPWLLTGVFLIAVSGVANLVVAERFMAAPLTLIVLGEALRRRSGGWTVGLTGLLFVEAIMAPETSFLTIAAIVAIVATDLMHRRPGESLWRSLRFTQWFAASGLAIVGAWTVFLAANNSVRAFIDYYIIVGPGHNVADAIPPTGIQDKEWVMFGAPIVAVLLTIYATAVKIARRADWEARDWVAVTAAIWAALYAEKALGRFDAPHVWQVFAAGLPLILLWTGRLLSNMDSLLSAAWARLRIPRLAHPVSAVAVAAIALALVADGSLQGLAKRVDQQHALAGATASPLARVGFATADGVDAALLQDLNTTLRAYAGEHGRIFDMTNSLGYFFYLLDRDTVSQFVHVSMSVPPYAQQLNIDVLAKQRPSVVIYDTKQTGLPVWDQLSVNIRHYQVSEYVLRNWTPVFRTHGVLVMVRNDLVGKVPGPSLSVPPDTTNLYFDGPRCDWGAVPNFLPSPGAEQPRTIPVKPLGQELVVDYTGWAVDPLTKQPGTILVADDHGVVAGNTISPSIDRPDVAKSLGQASSTSGFHYNGRFDATSHPALYLLGADGVAHPIGKVAPGGPTSLHLVGGSILNGPRPIPVSAVPALGSIDVASVGVMTVGQLDLPEGADLRRYTYATLSAPGTFGGSSVAITDVPAQAFHDMSAVWLPQSGSSLTMRVGSCPQWYGYDPYKPLYVVQNGGPAVTSVTLSVLPN